MKILEWAYILYDCIYPSFSIKSSFSVGVDMPFLMNVIEKKFLLFSVFRLIEQLNLFYIEFLTIRVKG